MIRSVVEIIGAIFINSVGVAMAAIGIETVDYGSFFAIAARYICRHCFERNGRVGGFAHFRSRLSLSPWLICAPVCFRSRLDRR